MFELGQHMGSVPCFQKKSFDVNVYPIFGNHHNMYGSGSTI